MKRFLTLAIALAAALPAAAQTSREAVRKDGSSEIRLVGARRPAVAQPVPRFTEGTPVVIVGEITSQPKDIIDEDKMQVAIGPGKMDYTLHLSGSKMLSVYGQSIDEDALANKMWVRAEGTVMDDPRRIKVTRLQVLGKDMPSLRRSAFYRPGFEQGYVVAVAGSRQIYPGTPGAVFTPGALVIVGKVSDDTGPLETTRKIQVDAAGNTWTVHVPSQTPVVDVKGDKISVHELAKGQWVRVHGWQTDDLRTRSARIQSLGAEEAFRTSTFYRAAEPVGYVERMPGTGVQFNPLRITGVVTAVNADAGTVTLRDQKGMERTFFVETVIIAADGRPADVKSLRNGQRVTVQGSEITF
jgi:hypothetical protein